MVQERKDHSILRVVSNKVLRNLISDKADFQARIVRRYLGMYELSMSHMTRSPAWSMSKGWQFTGQEQVCLPSVPIIRSSNLISTPPR